MPEVLPRDTTNGLEDTDLSHWCYWDGTVIKGDDGIYRMYASRWSQEYSHRDGWHIGTRGMWAKSKNLMGPYIDQGEAWPDYRDGLGHNVVANRLKDGRYALLASEITPGDVYIGDGPDGPFKREGIIEVDANGFYEGWMRYDELDVGAFNSGALGRTSNIVAITRHDGRYQIMPRQCGIMISDDEFMGPYKLWGDRAWYGARNTPQYRMEDPTFWYSDGLYHLVVNQYLGNISYHLTSEDGIDNWRGRGLAYEGGKGVFKYTDGTENEWGTVQRPTVYVEDGEVKAFLFSVVDTSKGGDQPNDKHGSKIVMVPFDGKAFGTQIRDIVEKENSTFDVTPVPDGWNLSTIGEGGENSCGYDEEFETFRLRHSGKGVAFLNQPISGDISLKTLVMYQDWTKESHKGGVMLRSSLDYESKFILATLSNESGLTITARINEGDNPAQIVNLKDIKAPYYLRLERKGKEVECLISTSDMQNWQSVAKVEIDLGEDIFAGVAAGETSGEVARFKATDLHQFGKPTNEGIIANSFPDTIPADGVIDFEVEYEFNQTLDVWVALEDAATSKRYKVYRELLTIPKNTTNNKVKVHYKAGEALKSGSRVRVVIKAVPLHLHDSQAVQSFFKTVIVE